MFRLDIRCRVDFSYRVDVRCRIDFRCFRCCVKYSVDFVYNNEG